MKYQHEINCILGVEIMETIDYTISARIMDYNVQETKRQLNDIAIKNRQLKELEQISWDHGGEFLYGVKQEDKVLPVLTTAFYCGWEKYDGVNNVLDLSIMDKFPPQCKILFNDYPIHIYSIRDLNEMNFQTGLRELIAIFKRCKDRNAMKEYYLQHQERFRQLDDLVIDALGALIGETNLNLFKQEGKGLDMCKAFEDERNEGISEGILQSIKKLMQNLNMTAEQAMDILDISIDERAKYQVNC